MLNRFRAWLYGRIIVWWLNKNLWKKWFTKKETEQWEDLDEE